MGMTFTQGVLEAFHNIGGMWISNKFVWGWE